MPNEELHQHTIELLTRLLWEEVISESEASLLCWHCGCSIADIKPSEPTATQKITIAEL